MTFKAIRVEDEKTQRNFDALEQAFAAIPELRVNGALNKTGITPQVQFVTRYDTAEGNLTIFLPDARANANRTLGVYKISAGGSLKVAPFPGQTIDGGTGSVTLSDVGVYLFLSDGANLNWMRF